MTSELFLNRNRMTEKTHVAAEAFAQDKVFPDVISKDATAARFQKLLKMR